MSSFSNEKNQKKPKKILHAHVYAHAPMHAPAHRHSISSIHSQPVSPMGTIIGISHLLVILAISHATKQATTSTTNETRTQVQSHEASLPPIQNGTELSPDLTKKNIAISSQQATHTRHALARHTTINIHHDKEIASRLRKTTDGFNPSASKTSPSPETTSRPCHRPCRHPCHPSSP